MDALKLLHVGRQWLALVLVLMIIGAYLVGGNASGQGNGTKTGAAAGETSPEGGPVLKPYAVPADQGEQLLTELRRRYEKTPQVNLAYDPRTMQLIVSAPEAVHQQIVQILTPKGQKPVVATPPTSKNQLRNGDAAAAARQNVNKTIALSNLNGRRLISSMKAVLGTHLTSLPASQSGQERFHIAYAKEGGVELWIDVAGTQVTLAGPASAVQSASKMIAAFDASGKKGANETQLVGFQNEQTENVQKIIEVLRASKQAAAQGTDEQADQLAQRTQNGETEEDEDAEDGQSSGQKQFDAKRGISGSVQVELIEGLGVVIIRGNKKDVAQVQRIINQIENLTKETEPAIEILTLKNVNSQAMYELLYSIYTEVFEPRQGSLSITALGKPNALLLIGRKENVQTVIDLVAKLDKPTSPDMEFKIFPLKYAQALDVVTSLNEFYTNSTGRGNLDVRVIVTYDIRTNTVIVQASPRDLAEITSMVAKLDVPSSQSVKEVRIIQLQHSVSTDLRTILGDALGLQLTTNTTGGFGGFGATANQTTTTQKAAVLQFFAGPKGRKQLESGVFRDTQITADTRSNSLIISAPKEGIGLLEMLVRELDDLKTAEAAIKVFQIDNGDATTMATMLQNLFSQSGTAQRTGTTGGFGGFGGATNQTSGFSSLGSNLTTVVPVRFAVDTRSNCIVVSGANAELDIVEAILSRLDISDIRQRTTTVYRLKNANSSLVSTAITSYLTNQRSLATSNTTLVSPFEQLDSEVIVVAETQTNSLIVSATKRYYNEIMKVIQDLDERPPMVMIQVMIAEVTLTDSDEFGIELGLQDSILFDRSTLSSVATGTALGTPGYAFNNNSLGNNVAAAGANKVGGQGLSSFSLGRTNSDLGYGGFVFSASSESLSVLMRALKQCNRVDVLSRPQVMTMDNQPASILVGQNVPYITGVQTNQTGQTNTIDYRDVGLILNVQPRITPDNMVVMYVQATKSDVGSEAEGIPVSISDGQVIRSPKINTTTASTTISAGNSQTVCIGGLLTKRKNEFHRKVPGLGDIPVLGTLFRYDGSSMLKTELLIILTPHIVRSQEDMEAIKRVEAARMNWCLSDVIAMNGDDDSLRTRSGEWSDRETHVVYPDADPSLPKPDPKSDKRIEPLNPDMMPTPPSSPTPAPSLNPSSSLQRPTPATSQGTPPMPPEPLSRNGAPAMNGPTMNQGYRTASQAIYYPPAGPNAGNPNGYAANTAYTVPNNNANGYPNGAMNGNAMGGVPGNPNGTPNVQPAYYYDNAGSNPNAPAAQNPTTAYPSTTAYPPTQGYPATQPPQNPTNYPPTTVYPPPTTGR